MRTGAPTNAESTRYPDSLTHCSMASEMEAATSSILTTTPFLIPREAAVPTPTILMARSGSTSPIRTHTLVVPTSSATTACSRGISRLRYSAPRRP